MSKYTPELVETLCENIAQGFTILEACESVGISERTFYNWIEDEKKIQFLQSFKKAEQDKLKLLKDRRKEKALKGINCLLEPFTYDEVTVIEKETEMGFTRETKTVTKTILPNVTALIFAMSNDMPDQFKRADKEVTEEVKDEKKVINIGFKKTKQNEL